MPSENIGTQLLDQFNEESDDGEEVLPPPVLPAKNMKWGPVVAPRMSARIQRDSRTAIQKAQDLKKTKYLEIPKGNSIRNGNSFSAFNDRSKTRLS